jgi:hypothetical protein
MTLYMRVPSPYGERDIETKYSYDNEADLRHSKDFPEEFFEIWREKDKLFIQRKAKKPTTTRMKTPNKGCFY